MGTIRDGDFDPEVWNEMMELFGREGAAEMLAALQRDLPQQQQQLEAAALEQDRSAVKRVAHSSRGVALQFGAAALAEHCANIERSIAGDAPFATIAADAARMLDHMDALIRDLHEALRGA